MPTLIKPTARSAGFVLGLCLLIQGCSEPSARELKNRQEFEFLLTAISLKDKIELENDAKRLDQRHKSGELSDESFQALNTMIDAARTGDWAGAEAKAYAFRDRNPYFR